MNTFKRSVIIDIDGTLYDNFSRDDKNIISELFRKNILVKLLDKCLWNINSLDLISNPMRLLKLRLKLYSLLSFKNFKKVEKEYKYRYQHLLGLDLQNKEKNLEKISEMYDIILVTSNLYAISVLYKFTNHDIIYSSDVTSRRQQIKAISLAKTISYIIGNNYIDDIFLSKRINVLSIYIGKSILKKVFKADFEVLSFNDVIEILAQGK
ncbi:MAG: hypothetical protein PHD15_03020 [Clostridia bacterium]|nr:hypothetical protein [Clostridia bacterium]MDD4386717.1 hypothetical protein [Clostridia bacterium]